MNLKSNQIRLIAFDLDGTLLNAAKVLTQRNKAALEHAAEKGILIVPTTGRLFDAIPEEIREFPFLRYAITINGAAVFDTETGDNIYRAEIPIEQAIEIMSYLDKFPIIYDCYKDNTGWMTQSMWDQAEVFALAVCGKNCNAFAERTGGEHFIRNFLDVQDLTGHRRYEFDLVKLHMNKFTCFHSAACAAGPL